jgi:hypothetical protein
MWAEIYKTVDENGNVTYSDTPKEKADAVDLPQINTQPAIQVRTRPGTDTSEEENQEPAPKRYQVRILSPGMGLQVPMGQQDVPVNVLIAPNLHKNHRMQLFVNGQPYGPASQSNQGVLKNIYRGEHRLHAAVVTRKGKVISQSSPITIFVQRRSVLN